ncbi:MAG: exo-alpha-sialidase [Rhodocyclales bacterium]|nr:exo-alpha-sialidase [Rhodocyclales bacterium]
MPKPVSISDGGDCLRRGCRLLTALLVMAAVLPVHSAAAADAMPAMKKAPRPELGTSAAFSPDGTLHVAAKQGEHVVVYRSADEGVSWSPPAIVNAQPEAIAADGEGRPKLAFAADGALLVSWTRPLGKPFSGEIRLARAADGREFTPPLTVHRDRAEITHRFDSLLVAPGGRVLVAWVDKRDLEAAKAGKAAYRGAAIYAAQSNDGGRSFQPEKKIADHSCECCRIAAAVDRDGAPVFMWRHVFEPNERDHALARVAADGAAESVRRATFDRWKIDGCPHHGPSLAVDAAGRRHAVWFNQIDGEGQVSYGWLPQGDDTAVAGQRRVGGAGAAHADLALSGARVGIVWKEFDGEKTRLRAELSADGGETFRPLELAATDGASDQPRMLRRGDELFAFWRTERDGMRLFRLR